MFDTIKDHPNASELSWLLVDGDLVETGGMDIANLRLAQFLADHFPVQVVTHRADTSLSGHPNVQVKRVKRPLNSHFLGGFFLDAAGRKVARINQQLRPGLTKTIVNGGNCFVPGSINWVHYVHAAYSPHSTSRGLRRIKNVLHRRQALRSERRGLTAASIVICNSHLTAKHVTELVGVPAERVCVVYYGIDVDRFYPASEPERMELRQRLGWEADRPYLLFIGALGDQRKGFDSVASALEILCREPNWAANLVVVGSGADKDHWERHFAKLGLKDRVSFLGFRRDVPDLLRAADALVAPTRYEAYGLGVHEAICCGLPTFVSRDSGVAERFPESLRARLLIEDPNDIDELAVKLQNWQANRGQYRSIVSSFCDSLRVRTWKHMAEEFVARVQVDARVWSENLVIPSEP